MANDAAEEILQIQDDQTVVDARIAQLESLLQDAAIASSEDLDADVVAVGRVVDVRYARTGKVATYRVGGTGAGDGRTVSARSPVGSALLGRVPGDAATVELPDGRIEKLEIVAVRPSPRESSP